MRTQVCGGLHDFGRENINPDRTVASLRAPCTKQDPEIRAVNDPITIEVGRALFRCAHAPVAEETQGPNHENTLNMLGTLATIELFNNEFSKGAVSFKALADRRSDLLGPTHPNTIMSRSNEAFCLGNTGEIDEAVAIYSNLLPTMRDALPAGDPLTMNALIRSGLLLAERGESAAAEARIREGVIGLDRSMQNAPGFWKAIDDIRSKLAEHPGLLERLDLPVRDSTVAKVKTP